MAANGVSNGTHASEPTSPQSKTQRNSLALTEYSAEPSGQDPSPLVQDGTHKSVVPDHLLLPNGFPDYIRLITTAKVYDVVEQTPLTHAINVSNRLETQVFLKREDLLPVFSFKLRGAYNKMAHLSQEERWKGVIACSAGNHAQGVAYSARKLRIPATITMPVGTPAIKHQNVSRLGGNVVLHGQDFDEAKAECNRRAEANGLINIPPFDDPYVIAGQGTIGAEILRQADLSKLEAIFCCVGGGGLIAGVGVYIKRFAPHIKIIGVETYDANALLQSLKLKKRVTLSEVGLFADGAAVKTVGEETFRICMEVVDDIIQVDTDDICAAIKDVFEDTRSILEPAGALSLAGLKKYVASNPSGDTSRQLVALASGANMNFDRLRFVAERAAIGEKKEALLAVTIPETPGSFAKLVATVNPMVVTEFCYRYHDATAASVLMGIQVSAATRTRDVLDLLQRLEKEGMTARDISGDEIAKSHIRYLVGGRSTAENERLFAFEFPERGGALYKFLTTLQPGFNISLFHYRNYGGDIGKVLAGIQCPAGEEEGLTAFLKELGYGYTEETDNETYKMFMRG
ncbi:probable threonine dehydratase, biosynthetic [Ramularia collo-cygni]|uniref:Threonine dehydratase n=1 Tax=Ramularia collo-cygni TaxID=112498 RepID=A0A2D3UQJ2_9PEZI|nr:probable threonine dehydratase, biosynthetic [Ramularia collo-cygni]CZT15515.1 probable threonine dehydratase, biosynthetic [Ramularia collo-cygni]